MFDVTNMCGRKVFLLITWSLLRENVAILFQVIGTLFGPVGVKSVLERGFLLWFIGICSQSVDLH